MSEKTTNVRKYNPEPVNKGSSIGANTNKLMREFENEIKKLRDEIFNLRGLIEKHIAES